MRIFFFYKSNDIASARCHGYRVHAVNLHYSRTVIEGIWRRCGGQHSIISRACLRNLTLTSANFAENL